MNINRLFAFAFLAMDVMACGKQELEKPVPQPVGPEIPTVEVRVNAGLDAESKSVFSEVSGNKMLSEWTTNKQISIYVGKQDGVSTSPEKAGRSTTFTASLPDATSGDIWFVSPKGTYNSSDASQSVGGFTSRYASTYLYVVIPTTQTPLANSCDESVHMVAASMAIPSTGIPSEFDLTFNPVIAFGKLTVRNFAPEKIQKVVLSFPNAVAGTSCKFQIASGVINNASSTEITLLGDNIQKDESGNFVFFFALAESTHESGNFVMTITDSEGKTYTKTTALSSSKSLSFTTGHMRQLGADMTGIVADGESGGGSGEGGDSGETGTASLIYSNCMEFPAVSPVLSAGQHYSASGFEYYDPNYSTTDKWYRTSTENSNQYIVSHTFQNNGTMVRNYSMLYDGTKRCALWAAFALNGTTWEKGTDVGRNDNWVYDPSLPQSIQPNLTSSYPDSNYDRGHQVASNDRQTTVNMNKQTFYFSNMTPQYGDLNSYNWQYLEAAVQKVGWACSGSDTLYVVTGPIFDDGYTTTKDKGNVDCPVPTRYYKCVMKCTFNSSHEVTAAKGVAYITPDNATNTTYTGWKTTIDAVEEITGFDFFTNVPTALQNAAEKTNSLSL